MKIRCYGCAQKLDVSDLEPFIRVHCPTCNTELIIPKPFGNFLLEQIIGSEEMATVFRAIDLTLDREVAVKLLNSKYARMEDAAETFINEARVSSAINHPNIIPIYTCGSVGDEPYLVMQFMTGVSLRRKIQTKSEPPSTTQIVRWMRDTVSGLDAAFHMGIHHRNVRPSNILLDVDGHLKVGDFGLAQVVFGTKNLTPDQVSRQAVLMKNHHYVSPEKVSKCTEDVKGDFFSLGATFYHIFAGHAPFRGDTPEEIINARFDAAVVPPVDYRAEIPREISDLLMALLSRDPGDRPKSYAEITAVLNSVIGEPDQSSVVMAVAEPRPKKMKSAPVNAGGPDEKAAIPIAIPVVTPGMAAGSTTVRPLTVAKADTDEPATERAVGASAQTIILRVLLGLLIAALLAVVAWQLFFQPGGPAEPVPEPQEPTEYVPVETW